MISQLQGAVMVSSDTPDVIVVSELCKKEAVFTCEHEWVNYCTQEGIDVSSEISWTVISILKHMPPCYHLQFSNDDQGVSGMSLFHCTETVKVYQKLQY